MSYRRVGGHVASNRKYRVVFSYSLAEMGVKVNITEVQIKIRIEGYMANVHKLYNTITLDVIICLQYDNANMIKTFASKETEKLFHREASRVLPTNIQRKARQKLEILDAVERLDDLRVPPGNRLEKLSGDRDGQHSIRINQQWRICFRWKDGDCYEVEIVDYH